MIHVSSLEKLPESVQKVAFVGDYLPRKCGIATFTHDLRNAVAKEFPNVECIVVAVNDNDDGYMYSKEVTYEFKEQDPISYLRVADYINNNNVDCVCVQHEYGIYGGPCGVLLLQLLRALRVPIVTTLHTILQEPSKDQRRILASILSISSCVVTMAEKGVELLSKVYHAEEGKTVLIPHGIPEMEFPDTVHYKEKLGFDVNKKLILTFGLLSPNKGIEFAIDAIAAAVNEQGLDKESFEYLVLGQTHPGIIRDHGEMYRHGLVHQAKEHGLSANVKFIDIFVDLPLLKEYIAACDVYLTPYLHEQQITSGTLSYAFGMGSAVVSTPYWHAAELLANSRGVLVPFRDAPKLGEALYDLLANDEKRLALKLQAFEHGRTMTWSNTARAYMDAFIKATEIRKQIKVSAPARSTLPDVRLDHLLRLTDDTGLIQHARFAVPDRNHGYSIDDNARALILLAQLRDSNFTFPSGAAHAIDTYVAYIAHCQVFETKRFRNFLTYDRKFFPEEVDKGGSEDSHARALLALGCCVRFGIHSEACSSMFIESFPCVKDFTSPRSWAFAILAMSEFLERVEHHEVVALRDELVNRLIRIYDIVATNHSHDDKTKPAWHWFEETATYDNAVIPQALIVSGHATHYGRALQIGLESLKWLFQRQVSGDSIFTPIGNRGWCTKEGNQAMFDQQPLEASGMVQACIAAHKATGEDEWQDCARAAFEWFMGRNVIGKALYDPVTHGCCDGLHENRCNLNQGAESVLAYLQALVQLKRDADGRQDPVTPVSGFSTVVGGFA